jgi:hypothetical protein
MAVELLFPSINPVVIDLPLILWAVVVCVLLFFFLWFKQEGSTQEAQVGGVASFSSRRHSALACFSLFFL